MSLRNILFDLHLFDGESERASSQKRVLVLLEALTVCNQYYLQEHPDTPLMYDLARKGIITYKLPAQFGAGAAEGGVPGYRGEVFRDIPRIIENGGGDCDNLAAWRAAEIRHHLGKAASPYITWRKRPDGGTTYHVIVKYDYDGSSEDPSLLLGMGGESRDKDRADEVARLHDRQIELIGARTNPIPQQIAERVIEKRRLKNAVQRILGGRRV